MAKKSLIEQAQRAMNDAMDIHPRVGYAGEAANGAIKVWLVAGRSGDYAVYEEDGQMHCTCEAGQRGIICYHRAAIKLAAIERDAAAAFNAALDASIASAEAEEDALAMAVGGWFLDQQAKQTPRQQKKAQERAQAQERGMALQASRKAALAEMDAAEQKATALPAWYTDEREFSLFKPVA